MAQSANLRQRLEALEVDRASMAVPGRPRKALWVQPRLKALVQCRTITTKAGMLRHSVWKGSA